MKYFLLLLFTSPCFAQFTAPRDSGYWFSREEVVSLANKIRTYKAKILTADSLIPLYKKQTSDFQDVVTLKDRYISAQTEQLSYARKNDSLYNEILKRTEQPSFWRDILLVSAGVLLGAFIGVHL